MEEELAERVKKFNALELPGQPRTMHMGTSYLVNDLWAEVKRLRDENEYLEARCYDYKERT